MTTALTMEFSFLKDNKKPYGYGFGFFNFMTGQLIRQFCQEKPFFLSS